MSSWIWANLSMCVSAQEDPEQGKTEDVRDARSTIDGESAGMVMEWKTGVTQAKSGTQSYLYPREKDKHMELMMNDGLS